jgi:2-oxoglutarate/2-oxoacid ferredoxin oxidoreductase subunit beta
VTDARRKTYLTDKFGPLPFCPGCGHAQLVKALDRALVTLQPDPSKVVVITDIGCIGLSDKFFITHGFHGLHGRSITYGCGMKLARPELRVIVLMGDGGCGIGGAHLLNVARRNIGITLIVANNLNYGMTGGQHSVTTPYQAITASTPHGNIETPMDICATVAAAGAGWAYRATAFDSDISEVMVQAIEHPGFSILEVWELCTAYYAPRNKLTKKGLFSLMDDLTVKRGLIANRPRPEYREQLREIDKSNRASTGSHEHVIEIAFDHRVEKQVGIVIAGSAGQKIRSAATLFAQASMLSGLNATQKDDYPITVQTGHSISEMIVGPERIDYTAIDSPDYFLLLSEDGLRSTLDRLQRLSEDCTVYAEESIDLPAIKARICRLPLRSTSNRIGKLSISTVALAAFLNDSRLFPIEAFLSAVEQFQEKNLRESALQAIHVGVQLTAK